MKMAELCPINVHAPTLASILCQLMAKLLDMDFKFVLPNIYINF